MPNFVGKYAAARVASPSRPGEMGKWALNGSNARWIEASKPERFGQYAPRILLWDADFNELKRKKSKKVLSRS